MPQLAVQEYLKTKTLDDLHSELGIVITYNDSDSRVILNYSQSDSPKLDPIARECRGLVLDLRDYSIVAKSFNRFFNYMEVAPEEVNFDFKKFQVESKEDGSLALIYYWNNKWRINTRGSFAKGEMLGVNKTWELAIEECMHASWCLLLDKNKVYICEFVAPFNRIVRRYSEPALYLLSLFDRNLSRELNFSEFDKTFTTEQLGEFFLRPTVYPLSSVTQITKFIEKKASEDPTWEGVVIRDLNNNRYKIKSDSYVKLHHIRGGGNNLYNPKHQVYFVLKGEESEILTHFPEAADSVLRVKGIIEREYGRLLGIWSMTKGIKSQKQFALAIDGKTSFTGLLFKLRKYMGDKQTEKDLRRLWLENEPSILKNLFKK